MKEKLYICKSEIIRKYYFTEGLITKYLKEPDKIVTNPHYSTAPKEKLWLIDKVDKISQLPEVKIKTTKIAERRIKKEQEKLEIQKVIENEKNNLKAMMELYSLDHIISKSNNYNKKYYIHCGPTNSGKTYNALKNINSKTKGQYVGPLRLLALEIYENLNNRNIPCSLITGEEEIIVSSANFTSSTVELCDYKNELDVLVIDEAQLISDIYRGHCYTKAILLAKAKEIHICIAPNALTLITKLLDKTLMNYEIINYKRLVPLEFKGYISCFDELKQGDALVVFSRNMVIKISNILESKKIKTSILYGNLPPQNRKDEIRKFINNESSILVCTDAIGLGVSLPIKRIVFYEDSKFDGFKYRKLKPDEIIQIAGRAGRYNIYPTGEYLYWKGLELEPIDNYELPILTKVCIPFPKAILDYLIDLKTIIEVWNGLENNDEIYHQNISGSLELIRFLDYKSYNIHLVYELITCPFDIKNDELIILWIKYSKSILNGKSINLPVLGGKSLQSLELNYKKVELYNRMSIINNYKPVTRNLLNEIIIAITKKLSQKCKS